jgi:hypothetical protein
LNDSLPHYLHNTKIAGQVVVNIIIRYDNNSYALYRPNIYESFIKIFLDHRARHVIDAVEIHGPRARTLGAVTCHDIRIVSQTRQRMQIFAVCARVTHRVAEHGTSAPPTG